MSVRYEKPVSPLCVYLAENVRRIRKAKGFTQAKLAKVLGGKEWTQTRVSELESARFDRVLSSVEDIARALKVPAWKLLHPQGGAEEGESRGEGMGRNGGGRGGSAGKKL